MVNLKKKNEYNLYCATKRRKWLIGGVLGRIALTWQSGPSMLRFVRARVKYTHWNCFKGWKDGSLRLGNLF
jgi:hypothetical protein